VTSSNLTSLLFEHPFPDDADLIHTIDGSTTAGVVRQAALDCAHQLRSCGVTPGSAVMVRLPNEPRFVTAMFGVWAAGAVLVPANPRQPAFELDHVLATTRPGAVVDESGVAAVSTEGDPARYGDGPALYQDDTAFVTWTSGTTGPPKAILQTHSGYLELLDRVLGPLRAKPADRSRPPTPNLVPVSLSLNAGIYNVLFGLRAGAALVLMNRFDTGQFAELVRRYAIRSTVLPPPAMVMLADDPSVVDLAPLRYVRSITAPLSPLNARRFTEKFGVTVLNGYGQAEIGEVIGWTADHARAHPEKIGAVGRPHPGVTIKVVSADQQEVAPNEIGELLVRPPRMAAGYAGGISMADRVDADGFVRTGDYARIDDDGFVWIEGRVSDLINRGGHKVFPDQVEEVLLLSPRVREVAVVGAPDHRLGEVPVAFVVGDAEDSELEQLCRQHLTPYKIPVSFERVPALPRSEVGKVLRRDLAARIESNMQGSDG
jgi:acyl-CoA synthetase (AMP-forming)/AMP-acid ligase II